MKIDNINPTQASNSTGHEQKEKDKTASAQSVEFARVKNYLHIKSRLILSHSIANKGEIIDHAKVAEIKQAITEGRFKVNSEMVADRLLETINELIQSQKDNT